MTPTRILLGAAGALALSTAAAAQTLLVQYDPVGTQASGTPVFPTTTATMVNATDLTQTGFVGAWGNTDVWPVGQLGVASPTLDPAQYVEFSITPQSSLQLTQLSYSRISYVNEGNRAASVRTSLDGFAADVDTITGIAQNGAAQIDFDLTSLPPLTAAVDLRIYFYDAPTTGLDWVDLASTGAGGNGLVLEGIVGSGNLGVQYCTPATPNSTGNSAEVSAFGSSEAAANDVTLTATNLPPMQFGIFLTSETQAATPVGAGTLCLGGNIIRFQGPGQILQADVNGEYSLQIDTTALPAGTPTPIVSGDTYNFTTWFRDVDPMIGNTANFSDGVAITFI